jgi:hypothetical protein
MSARRLSDAQIQQAHDAVIRHGSVNAAAKALGVARSTLDSRLKYKPAAGTMPPKEGTKVGKSLADFRASHDKDFIVPTKIRRALSELGEGWVYESDLLRLAVVSVSDLALYRDQFSSHWLVVDRSGKRVWAGSKALADKMREMIRG